MIRWKVNGNRITKNADSATVFGAGIGVISQAYIDAARDALGLPPQASDTAVMARLGLVDARP